MSKFYSGQDGQLFVNNENETIQSTDQIAKVRSWSFTINTSVLETVSLGDFDRTIIPGITSTTGSASIYYYAEPNNPRNANSPNQLLSDQIIQKILPRSSSNTGVPSSELRPKVKFRLGVDAKLTLGFTNLTDSEVNQILDKYAEVNSTYDHLEFHGGDALAGITFPVPDTDDSVLFDKVRVSDGTGKLLLRYRFDGPPTVTSVRPNRSNVQCKFVACLDGD